VDVITGNAAPTVSSVVITGGDANAELTVTYIYQDNENDAEGATTFQWYIADDGLGANEIAIPSATTTVLTLQQAYLGKYIRVGVTPKAVTGTSGGVEVKSSFRDGGSSTVSFTYNGQQVTYGIIFSAKTGRKWLDRNLGAPAVATASNDYSNYGDLFQWGRGADGHQRIQRNGSNDADMLGINGITSNVAPFDYSSEDVPGHNKFIVVDGSVSPFDWRKPQNDALWQGVNGVNNPCPAGWSVPTATEWMNEDLGTITEAFSKLKITYGSRRGANSGNFFDSITGAYFWTSSLGETNPARSMQIVIGDAGTTKSQNLRGSGNSVRCIKASL
jgi:uncharacterized protein (TIGR02145 family)